ncbi:hypothetical protein [Psychrobacillus sp.]|uniref:hypothetical protein n=1 Tax=Psychrobacillus sp. TaxID=1871623 RepID=UPI0028BDBACD|nr:hypothetical protein [Psychrobacillus sp.]
MKQEPIVEYDENLFSIDEQICILLKQRIDISTNNPSSPSDDIISNWALKYDLYEDYLTAIFGTIKMADFFKTRVEPKGFKGHLPVLKSAEVAERFYSITYIRQYENASVVHLNVDWNAEDYSATGFHHNHSSLELYISEEYDCRATGAGGSEGRFSHDFVVSPPLPADTSGLKFVFKEYESLMKENPTGLVVIIDLE